MSSTSSASDLLESRVSCSLSCHSLRPTMGLTLRFDRREMLCLSSCSRSWWRRPRLRSGSALCSSRRALQRSFPALLRVLLRLDGSRDITSVSWNCPARGRGLHHYHFLSVTTLGSTCCAASSPSSRCASHDHDLGHLACGTLYVTFW